MHLLAKPHALEQATSALNGDGTAFSLYPNWGFDEIFERGHVGEEIEVLEDHADFRPFLADGIVAELIQFVATLLVADQLAVDRKTAGVDLLQVIDAPEKGALA